MKHFLFLSILFGLGAVTSCSHSDHSQSKSEAITTELFDSKGKRVGEVTFTPKDDGTLVSASLRGLEAYKTHGFHIHQKGECKGDFTSAGGHFNPTGHSHGAPGEDAHAGDLGNVTSDSKGMVQYSYLSKQLEVNEGKHGVIGRSVILHQGKDDLKSQPSGDAGARLACGPIRS